VFVLRNTRGTMDTRAQTVPILQYPCQYSNSEICHLYRHSLRSRKNTLQECIHSFICIWPHKSKYIVCQIFMQSDIVVIHEELLGMREFSENQVSDRHTELQGINEFLCTFHIFWPVSVNTDITYRRSPQDQWKNTSMKLYWFTVYFKSPSD